MGDPQTPGTEPAGEPLPGKLDLPTWAVWVAPGVLLLLLGWWLLSGSGEPDGRYHRP